ncbi:response regulator [Candidatus Reidiella endopervernicosa]|uniref:Response regulator n=1 Tax=Candidatus Reidiella endopervernicosa TaxID=2738883 RepID=A0A6N0HYB5_9GAMM|nr:response regulator [Candidatus Reidiella endopervernicosa]QKQ27354.1 response regulator [Candidatus Reidiella endopervernicosa]
MRTSEQPRVLIVDDERQNLTILHDLLKNDYQIKVAINGKQALCRASSFPRPDIILLDIVMPEMDGIRSVKTAK